MLEFRFAAYLSSNKGQSRILFAQNMDYPCSKQRRARARSKKLKFPLYKLSKRRQKNKSTKFSVYLGNSNRKTPVEKLFSKEKLLFLSFSLPLE